MNLVYILAFIALSLFCYISILEVFNAINFSIIVILRRCLIMCGTTGDRISMPMDSPMIYYLRTLLTKVQHFNNTDNSYMLTITGNHNV
jgi:hypothetical protein